MPSEAIPIALTFGRFHTNSAQRVMTLVPGCFDFSLDVRAYDPTILDELEAELHRIVEKVGREYQVSVDLGRRTSAKIRVMSPDIRVA